MTEQLFKKAVVFGDIHFGLRGDSRQHNIDCETFVYWMIDEAKKFGAETCIFLGDWHHNRSRINVSTLNYTVSNLERLNDAFETVYFITGNHDLYYRDKREINSIEFGRNHENIKIISEPFVQGDVAIVPWLVGKEWQQVRELDCKYMFGHFELPYFKMNAMVEMPDTGELTIDDLSGPDHVFSGHFHKRQSNGNITYIGNAFPHNFSDVGDTDRGAMFLEWDETPEFKAWPEQPSYHRIKLSDLLERPDDVLIKNSFNRIEMDVNITYEIANFIRDLYTASYDVREIQMQPMIDDEEAFEYNDDLSFESVDSVVLEHLADIDSNNIDNELLSEIYRSL